MWNLTYSLARLMVDAVYYKIFNKRDCIDKIAFSGTISAINNSRL